MSLRKLRAARGLSRVSSRGFTLLELLIVISIIAILSVALILTINPAETLKKSRDAQRISDLSTLKTALGLILTASSTPYLSSGNSTCFSTTGNTGKVYYSYSGTGAGIAAPAAYVGADAQGNLAGTGTGGATSVASPTNAGTDGNGWVPVNFNWLPGGSPISNLPLDPVNSIGNLTAATGTDFVYRYVCQSTATAPKPGLVFEIDATLESAAYTSTDDKRASDGGDSAQFYEVGTNLKLLPIYSI